VIALAVLASSFSFFQTPSHNIGCVVDSRTIRCDTRFMTKYSQPRYKPKGCDLDWGPLWMAATGRVHVLCAGDTAIDPKSRVLKYGESRLFAGKFRCTSRTSGLRCQNRAHHGFFISREKQSTF